MDKIFLLNKLKEFGLNTREEYMPEAFSRNIGLLTQAEQDKLSNAKVAIARHGRYRRCSSYYYDANRCGQYQQAKTPKTARMRTSRWNVKLLEKECTFTDSNDLATICRQGLLLS